jgi:ribulose-phosphate 3-epimerase
MDGHLVPNLGFSLDLVAAVCAETSLPVDAHLMVERPQMYVGELAKAGVRRCFFHVEAAEPTLAAEIIDAGMVPGAAISPGTPVEALGGFDVPSVLVLSVPPGFAGQRWVTGTEGRVASVPAISGKNTVVGVDGNVNGAHARAAAAAGATLFVAGTASIFSRRGGYRDLTSDLRSHVVAGMSNADGQLSLYGSQGCPGPRRQRLPGPDAPPHWSNAPPGSSALSPTAPTNSGEKCSR